MKEEFKKIGAALYEKGLIHFYGGSLSIRQGDKILITKKGAILSDLSDEDIIETGLEPSGNDQEAALELLNHRAIYKESNAQAVVCAHPTYSIILAQNEEKLIPSDAVGKTLLRSVPVVRAREVIGSSEVTKYMAPVFRSGYAVCIVRGYASFAAAPDLKKAFNLTEVLERTSKIAYLSRKPSQPKPQLRRGHDERRRAIPPGIGVMDRGRERGRYKR